MIDEIKNKINNNNLEELTEFEQEYIVNNLELLNLFKDKLKIRGEISEKLSINLNLPLIQKIFFLGDFLKMALDSYFRNDYIQTMREVIYGSYDIEVILQGGFEIDAKTEAILNEYKKNLIPEIIEFKKGNIISDSFLINYIIDNNIYILANRIYIEEVNSKIEKFLIDANTKDNPHGLLYSINNNIIDELIKNNKLYKVDGDTLLEFINDNPNYEEKITKSIKSYIKRANENQLKKENYCFYYVLGNKDLSNYLLKRLTETNSNLINTDYNYSFDIYSNSYFKELVNDPTNPLNIDFNTYIYLIAIKEKNINLFLNSLSIKNEISFSSLETFICNLSIFYNDKKNSIIKILLEKGNFNKVEFYQYYNDIDDEIWIDYFSKQANVPINILEELQVKNKDFNADKSIENVFNNCSDNYYINDFYLFKFMSNDSMLKLYNKITQRLDNNKEVNFYYFLELVVSNIDIDYSYLNNSNIIFNLDQDTLELILTYISKTPNRQEFTDVLIKKLNSYDKIPSILYIDEYLENKYFKNTLLSFIDNKVNIDELIFNGYYFNKDILNKILNNNKYYIKNIITNIIHNHNIDSINNELFNIMLPSIISIYNIDENKFLKLVNNFGIKTITLLENEQFLILINYNNEQLDKFIEIFKERKLDKNLIVAINDSLKQNIFAKENQDILTIYTTIINNIQNGVNCINYIDMLIPYLNNFDLKKELINYYNGFNNDLKIQYINNIDYNLINLYNSNKILFFNNLFKLIKINQNIYGPYLHLITNKYIFDKRNEFSKNNDIFKDTNIKYDYDEKSLYDAFFNYLLKSNILLLNEILNSYDLSNIKEMKKLYLEKCHISVIDYSKNLISIRFDGKIKYIYFNELKNIKKEIIIENSNIDITEIFKNVNIEVLFNTVINNPNKYDSLLAIINKYKILSWSNIFEPLIRQLSITPDNGTFAFINAFDKIYDQELINTKNHSIINPYKIIKYCSVYSGFANCYKIILGLEDFELIKNNKGPNSAKINAQIRLDDTAKLQIEMFKKNEITIPSFIKKYNNLMVIVGNKCASFNLTHGERTGACMRSFGYADTLFKFCNLDSRGFHITFISPDTEEYISRVSGFRNGNTVFLNQLRFSVLPDYSNEDVINACNNVAKDLIELSSNSKMPIENVVISPSIAYEGYKTEKLSLDDIGQGVYTGYKDVTRNAVILATTGKNGIPVPLRLNPHQPIYKPVRLPVLEYHKCNTNVHFNIQRIKCLKQCILNSNDLEFYKKIDIDINELDKYYLLVYLGQDWFVSIDNDLNIEYDIIPGDDRANIELQEALNKINLFKEQYMGGKIL